MTHDEIRHVIGQSVAPGFFFASAGHCLRVEHRPSEVVAWEIFQGRLLDHSQTRGRRRFESWNIFLDEADKPAGAPLVSIKFDMDEGQIFVTRNLLIYAWEAYESQPNVIESRETRKWSPELVGTIDPAGARDQAHLARGISRCVWLAVFGSRLPVASIELPLPAFSLGQLAYFPTISSPDRSGPIYDARDLVEQGLAADSSPLEWAKMLETALRATNVDDVPGLAECFVQRWQAAGLGLNELPSVIRVMFNHLALSPYTAFGERLVAMLMHWSAPNLLGPAPVIDMIGFMLRHLGRHLTAFDLVTFHNLGANYPDALMLDALLKAYLAMIEREPGEFEPRGTLERRRRRALRMAWLLRTECEGRPVPEVPSSTGESRWVLPEPFPRVPEDQLLQPARRTKTLFADDPAEHLLSETSRALLDESIRDLEHDAELQELGTAIYLDRPLGIFKRPGEVDRTTLLSYEAFSRKIAEARLNEIAGSGWLPTVDEHVRRLNALPIQGFPISGLDGPPRPGVVALEDARRAADDFVLLRTTRGSLNEWLAEYDWEPLERCAPDAARWLRSAKRLLVVRAATSAEPLLTAFDEQMRPRIELGLGQAAGQAVHYLELEGIEYLAEGLRVLRADGGLSADKVLLPPRLPSR